MGEKTIFPPYRFLTRRYPRLKLDEIRATVSEYYWMAQYAQEPSLGNLAFFKTDNLPRYDFPDVVRCWTSWDCAQTATKSGSFSAGVALGLTQDDSRMQVLDVRVAAGPKISSKRKFTTTRATWLGSQAFCPSQSSSSVLPLVTE